MYVSRRNNGHQTTHPCIEYIFIDIQGMQKEILCSRHWHGIIFCVHFELYIYNDDDYEKCEKRTV